MAAYRAASIGVPFSKLGGQMTKKKKERKITESMVKRKSTDMYVGQPKKIWRIWPDLNPAIYSIQSKRCNTEPQKQSKTRSKNHIYFYPHLCRKPDE